MDGDGLIIIRKGWGGTGLTQAEMAHELSVSRQSYIAWEKGHHKIPSDKLKLLLDKASVIGSIGVKVDTKKQNKEDIACFEQYATMRTWPCVPFADSSTGGDPHINPHNGSKWIATPTGLLSHEVVVAVMLHSLNFKFTPGACVLICTAYPDVPRTAAAFTVQEPVPAHWL